MSLAPEEKLAKRARRERAGLQTLWAQAHDLPARRRAWLFTQLSEIEPMLVQRNGSRVPCEPPFKLPRRERRYLTEELLLTGASRAEILATGIASSPWLKTITRELQREQMSANPSPETALECGEKSNKRLKSTPPVVTPSESQEDALYGAVFVGTELGETKEGKAAERKLREQFPQLGDQVIERLRDHEGNARCGILASALPGYSREQVIRMVDAGAGRDSWRIAGLEPPADTSDQEGWHVSDLNREYRQLADRYVESGFDPEIGAELDRVFEQRARAA
jgi:hypothetical protein